MEIRTEKRVVEEEVCTYIASDGKEFARKVDCEIYEDLLRRRDFIEQAESLLIEGLDIMPLTDDDCPLEHNYYYWYKINNPDDFEVLKEALNDEWVFSEKEVNYPEIICIESNTENQYESDDVYSYKLSEIIMDAKRFFNHFGLEMILQKVGE